MKCLKSIGNHGSEVAILDGGEFLPVMQWVVQRSDAEVKIALDFDFDLDVRSIAQSWSSIRVQKDIQEGIKWVL